MYTNNPRYKKRRCRYYEDNGRPRGPEYGGRPGCPEIGWCGFAHPNDPQWLTAEPGPYTPRRYGFSTVNVDPPVRQPSPKPAPVPPSAPPKDLPQEPPPLRDPPPSEATNMPRTWHSRASVDRGVDREMGKGKLPQREGEEQDPRSRTHYREGSGRARDASPGASSIASSADPRMALRKMASTSSIQDQRRDDERDLDRDKERAREREHERERERERDRERDRRYREEDRRREDDKRREDVRRYDSRRRDSRDDDYRRRDDDERRGRRRSESRTRTRREFSEDEKRHIWAERVQALSESVLARTEYLRLQDDAQTYERLRNSAQYEHLPADDRTELEKLVRDTKHAFAQKQLELNRTVARLVPRDFFPFAQPPERQSDSAFIEMNDMLSALQNDVKVMHEAVEKLLAVPLLPATSREASEAQADAESSGDRPRKRRRLSIEPGSSRAQDASLDQSGPSMQELEAMKDGLVELTGRISNVENDLQQYSNNVQEEVEAQLDYQLPDFGVPTGKDKKTHGQLSNDVDMLRGDVDAAEQRAETVLAALAKLNVHDGEEDETNAKLREQNEKLRQIIAEMEEHQKETSAKLDAQTAEINALNNAVQAYISSPAQFPAPPPQLSAAEIMATVRSPLLVELRQRMQPLLEDARAEIEKLLQQQLDQVNGALLAQITPTMRAIEVVSNWVEKVSAIPPGGTAPPPPMVDEVTAPQTALCP